jgi:hypothetical protein
MNSKIKFGKIATEIREGKLTHVSVGTTYKTMDELREHLHEQIDLFIDHIIETSSNHECTTGVVVYPLIHVVWDDVNKDNKQYQEIKQSELN